MMVTQDGDHAVGVVVRVELLLHRALLRGATVEEVLERQGRVIRTEDLSSQALHVRRQVTVQRASLHGSHPTLTANHKANASKRKTHVDTIEQFILGVLAVLEDADVLVHLLVDRDLVVVPDRVFAQEVEHELVGRLERDVLAAQRATADGIRFVVALLVASSKREFVNEVHRCRTLTFTHVLVPQRIVVVVSDLVYIFLKTIKQSNVNN